MTDAYTPRPGSLAEQICTHLKANPGDELGVAEAPASQAESSEEVEP